MIAQNTDIPLNNPQWENFARIYFEGKSAEDAYKQAGFKSNYPRKNAPRLLKKPEIVARIRHFKSEAAIKAGITQEVQAQKLEDLRLRCKQNSDSTGENAAIREQNKLYGLSIDKQQTDQGPHKARTALEQRADRLVAEQLLKEAMKVNEVVLDDV